MTKKTPFPEIQWESDDIDEIAQDKSAAENEFEQLLAGDDLSFAASTFNAGDKLKASVASVSETSDQVLVDLGSGRVGVLAFNEFAEKDLPSPGEPLTVYVISSNEEETLVSLEQHASIQNEQDLQRAFAESLVVKGKVLAQNKGGLDVGVFGKRAFCPWSQVDIEHIEDASNMIGKDYDFLIERLGAHSRDMVVSRAKLLKQRQAQLTEQLLEKLEVGQELTGTVTKLADYGAFVDIGGIEGLVHISEISHVRIAKPADILTAGESVSVRILNIETQPSGRTKISLSIKQTEGDPFERFVDSVKLNEKFHGEVVRLANFGAFVQLTPGVDGLLHISAMRPGKRLHHPREFTHVGAKLDVYLTAVDQHHRRLSLALEPIQAVSPGSADTKTEEASKDKAVSLEYRDLQKNAHGTLGALLAAKQKR